MWGDTGTGSDVVDRVVVVIVIVVVVVVVEEDEVEVVFVVMGVTDPE